MIGAIFYALALVPTAVTHQTAPQPLARARLDLKALRRNSPLAVVAVVMVGVSNSAFGTLGAVFGAQSGLSVPTIALFMSLALVAGAACQVPLGVLSDRMDRRHVLIALAVTAAVVDIIIVVLRPESPALLLTLVAIFGASIFGMYPVIVAHANDHAAPNTSLQTSGGLLLLFGLGSIAGPLLAGGLMTGDGGDGPFRRIVPGACGGDRLRPLPSDQARRAVGGAQGDVPGHALRRNLDAANACSVAGQDGRRHDHRTRAARRERS